MAFINGSDERAYGRRKSIIDSDISIKENRVNQITDLNCVKLGFVNVSGFDFMDTRYDLISVEYQKYYSDMYSEK